MKGRGRSDGHIAGESGDHNRATMMMTDMTRSVMAGTATVCNHFTVPTNVQQVNVGAK